MQLKSLKRKIKYFGLIIGIVCISLSFLFFGRQQDTYQVLLLFGLLTCLIFYIIIIATKSSIKNKLIWTGICILAAVLVRFAEPFLIDTSYRIYIVQNKTILKETNAILAKNDGIVVLNDEITSGDSLLTIEDRKKLIENRQKLGVYMITSGEGRNYYGLWGFLDIRLGLVYSTDNLKQDNRFRHLTGNWYH